MKTLLTTAALVLLVSPAALAAPPEGKGKPEGVGASQAAPSQAQTADESPAKQCRAERERMGVEAFRAKYGTNPNKANAFGKCVSQKAKALEKKGEETRENAAWKCKAERERMGVEAFRAKYGTNPNKANAFGKCVSQKARGS